MKRALRGELPDFMVPTVWMHQQALPLSPSGKVDRHRLPEPVVVSDIPYVAPETPTEILLAVMWAELLSVEQVGIHDVFFDLGGHSLLATQLAAKIMAECDVELPLRQIFETPTIADLAKAIDAIEPQQLTVIGKVARESVVFEDEDSADLGEDDIDLQLAELDGMSDEEMDAMLNNLMDDDDDE